MNREIWFSLLQVAVVAPYLYSVSDKQNIYFKLGLKLVAGALVVRNVPILFEEIKPLILAAQKLQQESALANKTEAIEGDFKPVTG